MDAQFLCRKRQAALGWLASHPGPHTEQALVMALAVTPDVLRVILDSEAFLCLAGWVRLTETGELAALALPERIRFAE